MIGESYQMELRHLRYFLAVAQHCHFRNAAEELLVSQPTLSQQIKDLERELGIPLFERVGRRARLTQAGETYRDYAQRALDVLEEGQSVLNEFDDLLRGRLTAGVVQTVNAYLIPKVVARFASEHPEVNLKVEELSAGEIENRVLGGSLDVGVSFTPTTRREFDVEKLFEEQLVLVLHPDHPVAKRKRIRVSQLSNERFCLLDRSFCTRRLVEECFRSGEATLNVAVEMNSVEGIIATLEAGGPPSILPRLAVTSSTILKSVELQAPTPARTICVLRSKGHAPIRARDVFVDQLKHQVAET
ncbi:HTH-type transcriptional regulator CynR [Thalassoglobus neptunius]|uniref:HTH-type transcriptional regulator CynR n=1 Tax=Thalassoglobus neptunius TaxID=1938619 RepID=A0A5C5V346_9PLAN|nr:LysR substrate-binding domain-containing protein [Thalassoglobus neptunius]TWT32162.1 HTH-type transcriptional regulator CynR [Thalassoglobus neptunius]